MTRALCSAARARAALVELKGIESIMSALQRGNDQPNIVWTGWSALAVLARQGAWRAPRHTGL
jgi:hypothetical protein